MRKKVLFAINQETQYFKNGGCYENYEIIIRIGAVRLISCYSADRGCTLYTLNHFLPGVKTGFKRRKRGRLKNEMSSLYFDSVPSDKIFKCQVNREEGLLSLQGTFYPELIAYLNNGLNSKIRSLLRWIA